MDNGLQLYINNALRQNAGPESKERAELKMIKKRG